MNKTYLTTSLLAAGLALASSALTATSAQAATFGFTNITGNSATNAATGESQLSLNVTDILGGEDGSSSKVLFTFNNMGASAASITQIYWDHVASSPLLKSIDQIFNGSGVSYENAKGNLNLPGGNDPTVNFTEDFGVEASSKGGVQPNGVNPGETLGVLFSLQSGKTLSDVFSSMGSGDLRVGFHVQGFGDGGSESFVNGPQNGSQEVPEPATMGALALVGGGILSARRNRMKQNA